MSNSTLKKRKIYYKFFGKNYRISDSIIGWSFLLPAIVLGIIFIIMPIIVSLAYAFTDANLLKLNQINYIGIDNFIDLFKDQTLFQAFKNTMEFVVKVVPLQLITALGLALLVNKKIWGNTFFRWAFFVPVMLSLAVTSMLWLNLLNAQEGLLNALFTMVGLPRQKFLGDPKQAMDLIVVISAWQGAGYQMLIFLSGLKNIPHELYEAASMDGASRRQQFFRVTLPCIKPTFSFVLITMMIGAFRLITQPMIMTLGGPINKTLTMSYYIYQQGITYRDVGYSSAIALVYTLFMAIIALTLRRLTEKDNTV